MFHIKTLNSIAAVGLDLFPQEMYQINGENQEPDGIVVRSFQMHEMEVPASLKAVARAGAGVNNIPTEKYAEQGVVVFNTPGANANAVKELVIAALLLSSRRILQGIQWAKTLEGKGSEVPKLVEKGKGEFVGPEIKGKTLGVIGLGAIGVMVANDAQALGMEVMGFDPYISVEAAWGLSRAVKKAASLEALLAACDYISIHIPLNDKTKNMFNEKLFSGMKKGARLLNFSRAELVETEGLKAALEAGILDCYVTDFPTEEMLTLDKVIPIPHLGASTPESEDNCAVMAVQQLQEFLQYGNIKNSVNYPDCAMPYVGKTRITVAHKNVPNMVGQITTVLAQKSINIADMINKSRGNWAYTMIDIDGEKNEDIIGPLQAIEGVIKVRVL